MKITERRWNQDPEHQKLLDKFDQGEPITDKDLWDSQGEHKYQALLEEDFFSNQGWHKAPILVATNCEPHTLNMSLAKSYAKHEHQVVYRWKSRHSCWLGKPPTLYIDECIERDGAF